MTVEIDPRVVRSRQVVLAAAQASIIEEGFGATTIDGIARRSGVARTTIYRHWESLSELLIEAVGSLDAPVEPPDTGSLRDDCLSVLGQLAHALRTACWGRILPAMIEAGSRDREVHRHQAQLVRRRRLPMIKVLERARDRGELSNDAPIALLAEELAGPVFYRHLISHELIDAAYLEVLVDGVVGPVTRRRR